MKVEGRWRIVEMELGDREAIDLMGPRDGLPAIECSWEGNDESEPVSGRGWATPSTDRSFTGRIFFHMGDDWSFSAVREGSLA